MMYISKKNSKQDDCLGILIRIPVGKAADYLPVCKQKKATIVPFCLLQCVAKGNAQILLIFNMKETGQFCECVVCKMMDWDMDASGIKLLISPTVFKLYHEVFNMRRIWSLSFEPHFENLA